MLKPTDVEARFGSVWESTYENNPDELKSIEKDLKCCGFKSPVDMAVPAHCAVKKHYGFSTGCLELLEQQWHGQRSTVVWVGVAMVGAQIVSLLLGAELGRRYRSTSTEPRRTEESPLLRA
ncbi:hypothetical protein EV175_007138 [Coemansia sp. RSA 1933]|nr:hypothetical protein EV175_007138 [Coemansia sp. RSA 1933]